MLVLLLVLQGKGYDLLIKTFFSWLAYSFAEWLEARTTIREQGEDSTWYQPYRNSVMRLIEGKRELYNNGTAGGVNDPCKCNQKSFWNILLIPLLELEYK